MRVVNYRTFLYAAINVLIAAFFAIATALNVVLGVILFIALIITNLILVIVLRKKTKYAIGSGISAVLLAIMLLVTVFTVNVNYAEIDYRLAHDVHGKVYSVQYSGNECLIVIDGLSIDGTACKGKMKLYVETELADKLEFLQDDYEIVFADVINKVNLVDGFLNPIVANDGIRYTAYLQSEQVEYIPVKLKPLTSFRIKLKNALIDFMGLKYGNIAYGILTGNRSGIDSQTLSYFSAAGLGHILAVSGLHIGFLISAIMILMKKLSAKIKVPIAAAIMVLYAVFAGFSASVLRAAIMSSIGMITIINGQRSDLLNNLSLAFSVLLAFSPFALFDAGFIMSFSAVFGIACFGNIFNRMLQKIRVPRFLASAISVSAAAQLGITPCLLFYFHSLPLYSVLANIVLMPLITLAFISLIITSVITMLIGSEVVLIVPQTFLIMVDGSAKFAASLPLSQLTIFVGAAVFFLLPCYFLISGYFMLPKFKFLLNIGVIVCCIILGFSSVTTLNIKNSVIPINTFNDVSSVVFYEDKTLIVGDCKNSSSIKRLLNKYFIAKVDGIYLTSVSEQTAQTLIDLQSTLKFGTVYCPYTKDANGLATLAENNVEVIVFESVDKLPDINHVYFESKFIGYNIEIAENRKLLFLPHKSDYSKLDSSIINETAIIRCKTFTGHFDDRIFLTNFSLKNIYEDNKYIYSLKNCGNYVFDYKEGKVYK